jgi:predicted ATPase/DNA-binding winged helix-turn-helix (wHTH) protein
VRIGARALDLLAALLEHAPDLVGRDVLMAAAWPGLAVEDINLRVQITALRKVLGDGRGGARFIVSAAGRGYAFVAPVSVVPDAAEPSRRQGSPPPVDAPADVRLPTLIGRVVGRERSIGLIARQLAERRLLTVVGPGGVGKTTVALASAQRFLAESPQPAAFVDLQALTDPAMAASALATQLRVPTGSGEAPGLVADFLADKRWMIVLDNCEHMVDAVAALAETIVRAAPEVSILATSREPLRAEGEWVHHLASLAAPPAGEALTAAAALAFPAVQLFVDRVAANIHGFVLEDRDAGAAGEICRRLDGMPLAIELAAARVELFGLAGLADRLDARFSILTAGRRTALPRHQTLRATLDWSYDLLTEAERAALRRIALFAGAFSIEAAGAVAADGSLASAEVFEAVMALADKSLLAIDAGGETVQFRLLETTRAYALERLADPVERAAAARRHAGWCLQVLRRAEVDWRTLRISQWLALYGPLIGDVRAALDWAYADGGDEALGTDLTVMATGLGQLLALYGEFYGRVLRALRRLAERPEPDRVAEARLNLALGNLAFNLFGPTEALARPFRRALDLAEILDDDHCRIEALAGMWLWAYAEADYRVGQDYARRLDETIRRHGDPTRQRTADRMAAISACFMGEPAEARRRAEAALAEPPTRVRPPYRSTIQIDREVSMRVLLARVAWLEGRPDDARDLAQEALSHAERFSVLLDSTLGFCALPVALWRGDLTVADSLAARLARLADAGESRVWKGWSRAYGVILRASAANAVPTIDFDLDTMQRDTLFTLAEGLADARALARAEAGEAPWCAPEILRAAGATALRDQGDAAAAEARFQGALDLAHEQGAMAWSLRAATSLAALRRDQDRRRQARAVLEPVLGRFTQGFATADVTRATALLAELA